MLEEKVKLSNKQKHIIKHALGLDNSKTPYRNHYAVSPGTVQLQNLLELQQMGLMASWPSESGKMIYFNVTEKGAQSVGATLPED